VVTTRAKTKTKGEKPSGFQKFLNFLGIKKKAPATTSPELQRYELELILDDILRHAEELPANHPRKGDLKGTVETLDRQSRQDLKKATELAQGVLQWAVEELATSRASQAQAPPQQVPPTVAQAQMQPAAPAPTSTDDIEIDEPPPPYSEVVKQTEAVPTAGVQDQVPQTPPSLADDEIDEPPPPYSEVVKLTEAVPRVGSQDQVPPAPASPTLVDDEIDEPPPSYSEVIAVQAPPAYSDVIASQTPPVISAEKLKTFKEEKALGSGKFATTYKMSGTDGAVAVKAPKLRDEPTTEAEEYEAKEELAKKEEEFKREAEFYAKVGDHPNIAKCYGYQTVGEGEGKQTGLVLELVEGKTAKDTMDDLRAKYLSGEVSAEEYWGVMQYTLMQMLQAADHMGKHGVSHRDLKPDNVMIDGATGEVKVVDFGVSQVIGEMPQPSSLPVGFSAPEISLERPPGETEDSFGVGATGYFWREQEAFNYKSSGRVTDETLAQYHKGDRTAIEIDKPRDASETAKKSDEDVFEELQRLVLEQLKDWEEDYAEEADATEARQIREWADRGRACGEQKSFSDGVIVLRTLSEKLRLILENEDDTKTRFPELLEDTDGKVNKLEDDLIGARGLAEPGRLKALLESVRTLAAKARQHGDRLEFKEGLALLEEIKSRLDEAERPSGKHPAESAYTDFINQLMHPDPAKRLTPEQALQHPFMQANNRVLSDEQARHALQLQNLPPGGAADPGQDKPADKRWQALDRAILDAERQVKALRSALPDEAEQRQSLVNQMQSLGSEADRANQKPDDAWDKFRALNEQLKEHLASAQKDQDARRAFQAELNQLARLVKALSSQQPADTSACDDMFRQAGVLSKPGGSLDEAQERLEQIRLLVREQFDDEARLVLFRDGLANVQAKMKEHLETAKKHVDKADEQLKALVSNSQQAKEQVEAAHQARQKGDKEALDTHQKLAADCRKMADNKKRDAEESKSLAARYQNLADDAGAILEHIEQTAAENIDAALFDLDRAAELLQVSLVMPAPTTSPQLEAMQPVETEEWQTEESESKVSETKDSESDESDLYQTQEETPGEKPQRKEVDYADAPNQQPATPSRQTESNRSEEVEYSEVQQR
jgi:serine/threonine protein kinase